MKQSFQMLDPKLWVSLLKLLPGELLDIDFHVCFHLDCSGGYKV